MKEKDINFYTLGRKLIVTHSHTFRVEGGWIDLEGEIIFISSISPSNTNRYCSLKSTGEPILGFWDLELFNLHTSPVPYQLIC